MSASTEAPRPPRLTLGDLVRPALLLTLLVIALNAIVLNAFFVGDDFEYLKRIGRMSHVREVLRFEYWGEWEPLWHLSWYLDIKLWGMNPAGFHVTNTIWLVLTVVGLFALVRLAWPEGRLAAWCAALVFATHPLQDEAVAYLAARGHLLCAALVVLTLALYTAGRLHARHPATRYGLIAASFVTAVMATLAKETALILPVWIGLVEWLVVRRATPRVGAFSRSVATGLAFLAVPGLNLLMRSRFVELESHKLDGEISDVLEGFVSDGPLYALLGVMPVPFALLDEPAVERFAALGWIVLAVATLCGLVAFGRALMRNEPISAGLALYGLGLALAAGALSAVLWAELPLRRRYLFVSTLGIALGAGVLAQWLARRRPREARIGLSVLLLVWSAATVVRYDLYRHAGNIVLDLIETVRGAPVGAPVGWATQNAPRAALINLPARYGGDNLSGAYVLHHTDYHNAFVVFGPQQERTVYALRHDHAEDVVATASVEDDLSLAVTLSFRTPSAFDAALDDPPHDKRRGYLHARLRGVDSARRTLHYGIAVPRVIWSDPRARMLLYSNERFLEIWPWSERAGDPRLRPSSSRPDTGSAPGAVAATDAAPEAG